MDCGFIITKHAAIGIKTIEFGVQLVERHRVEELVSHLLNDDEATAGEDLQSSFTPAH